MLRVIKKEHTAVLAACGVLFWAPLSAQEVVIQTLDRVAVNSVDSVLEMNFNDPMRDSDFVDTGISGAQFRACRLTAIDGVFCLDGEVVRNWPSPDEPLQFTTVLDCRDPSLNLDSRRSDICSGLTVDPTGAVWVAGRNKSRTFSLMKAVRKQNGSCPDTTWSPLSTDYCAKEIATGRPLLIDINSVDGEVAENFEDYGAGILGLEERRTATFFKAPASPGAPYTAVTLVSGKQAWGLQGPEELQSIGLVQVPVDDDFRNFILATTSNGRILAVDAAGGTARKVFDLRQPPPASMQCNTSPASFGIRASAKSGLVYVTDRQYCQVVALAPTIDNSGRLSLANATEPDPGMPGAERNLTLSTGMDAPEGPSVAPGIGIDLTECAGECTLLTGNSGEPAATLSGVTLLDPDGPSGLTLFQIKNLPDCRYIPFVCLDLPGVDSLDGIVIGPPGNPAAQSLNMTALLPREVTDLFSETELPDMLMSRHYRAQEQNGFVFEALFGVTEEGVVFRDTFVGEFDVGELVGVELGCETGLPPGSPLSEILEWDVVTTVSERFETLPGRHFDTLTNFDCGSSRSITGRWSLKPYNLEITPCTFNGDPADVWKSDGCMAGIENQEDDAVFAKLLLSLYDELFDVLDQVACEDNFDSNGSRPLSEASCSTLESQWVNGKDKLDKCWAATQQPKQSSGDQNCQAFVSQLSGLSTALANATGGDDPANRRGELRARLETIFHVYNERFIPSIPAAGFQEP